MYHFIVELNEFSTALNSGDNLFYFINRYNNTNILIKNIPNIIIKIWFFDFSFNFDHKYIITKMIIGTPSPIIIYLGI